MRKIVLYIAMSLDGYIAAPDGGVAWLDKYNDEKAMGDIDNFMEEIDAIIMGRVSYEQVVTELCPGKWPYQNKKCYVFSRTKQKDDENVEFVYSETDIKDFCSQLKNQDGKNIWLFGGGKIVNEFIQNNAVDEYIITIIPTILGNGILLFSNANPKTDLTLIESKEIGELVQLRYARV